MKYLLVRCEDAAVAEPTQLVGLLEVAKLSALHQLAQAGAVGVLSAGGGTSGQGGLFAHWGWLGYAPTPSQPEYQAREQAWAPGRAYATTLQLDLAPDQWAWCCDLVTQRDGRLVDPTAGRLTTKEARSLIESLNECLGSSRRRWVLGEGWRHVLITETPDWASPDSPVIVDPPERLVGTPWARQLPRGPAGEWRRQLIEAMADVLDHHEINRVRIDLGEDPANLAWLWGPGTGGAPVPFPTRYGLSGAIVGASFPLRGLARVLGLTWSRGIERLEEREIARATNEIMRLLATHDVVYVPIRIEETDPVARQCAMERLDQGVIHRLAEEITRLGHVRYLVAVEDRRSGTAPFAAVGPGIPNHPAVRLTAQEAGQGPLTFRDWADWNAWLWNTSGSTTAPRASVAS